MIFMSVLVVYHFKMPGTAVAGMSFWRHRVFTSRNARLVP